MTKRECAIIMVHTGTCMLKGKDIEYFYEYLMELMGRPVFTHEIPQLEEELKEKSREDFINLCRTATDVNEGTADA